MNPYVISLLVVMIVLIFSPREAEGELVPNPMPGLLILVAILFSLAWWWLK